MYVLILLLCFLSVALKLEETLPRGYYYYFEQIPFTAHTGVNPIPVTRQMIAVVKRLTMLTHYVHKSKRHASAYAKYMNILRRHLTRWDRRYVDSYVEYKRTSKQEYKNIMRSIEQKYIRKVIG